tara:strand:- start:1836 stop:2297 length:462 start_codon:yes stop_codon:yes gene_type:complete
MSIQKNKLFIRMSKILLLLTAVYAMVAYSAASNNAKNKELIIHVDPSTHCATKVAASDNESNCALLYAANKNPCKNDPECVCSKKEKYISWQTTTGDSFDVHFTQGSPFKNCAYSADRNGKVRCKIKNKGDYYYEINVKGCATNPYDPRIVVQ